MLLLGRVGRSRAGRRCLAALAAAGALVVPAAATAAPLGSEVVQSARDSNPAGSAEAFKAVASASASVNRLSVYLDATSTAARVDLALYGGSSKPGSKLRGCSISAPVAGWNACVMSPEVRLTKGRTYWTALLQPRSSSGVVRFRDRSGGSTSYMSSSTALSGLPSSYRTGSKWPSAPASIFADSAASTPIPQAPPAPPPAPTPAPAPAPAPAPTPPPPPPPPAPAPHPTPAANDCMQVPSACGYPDATNTGTLPGVARAAVTGTITLSTPGQVYENKTVTGGIVVTASNVTIRNVKVISRAYQAIRIVGTKLTGVKVQDSEIDLGGDVDAYGIIEDGYTAERLFIHNGSDCGHLGRNATIRDSFCSVGPDANADGWADSTAFCSGPEHFDGFSSDGGANQVYDHNTIRNPCGQTSAILISTNSAPISNVTITDNLMAGGGWTLYCAATTPGVSGTEIVTGNRFARTYRQLGGYYGPAAYCDGVDTWAGNVWDDTGRPLS